MPKSTFRSPLRRTTGTVTVIEARVHRSFARNARLAFYLTTVVVGLLTATVTAEQLHPILALFAGIVVGIVCGATAWMLVRCWPVIRLLWWWTPEILLALTVVYGWMFLARHTHLVVRLLVLVLVVGVPLVVAPIRRRIVAWAWCVIVRHRLRVCFAEFIIANQSGTLPLILLARPTPVGERVWIYLRPGLSLPDLESRLDKIAVACHASAVTIDRASQTTAAYLRIDVKRRQVLDTTIDSPLVDLVDPDTPTPIRPVPDLPVALDLPDIGPDVPAGKTRPNGHPTRPPAPAAPASATTPAAVAAVAGPVDDVTDWI
ncbi:MAG TPA: hypothetical protein VFB74_02270 [Kribbellaceae bacterium]|nr:hypothetical protein [Kribbellaceae bacterium]